MNAKPIPQGPVHGSHVNEDIIPNGVRPTHLHRFGGLAVGKVRRLLTGRGASRRGFESLALRTSRRSLLGRSASLITTRQVVRLHPTGLMPL